VKLKSARISGKGKSLESLIAKLAPEEPYMLWANSAKYQLPSGELSYFPANNTTLVLRPKTLVRLQCGILSIQQAGAQRLEFELAEGENPFELLRAHFDFLKYPVSPSAEAFVGGLMGFISYDVGRFFERLKNSKGSASEPDIFLLESPISLRFDQEKEEFELRWLEEYASPTEVEEIEKLLSEDECPLPARATGGEANFSEHYSREKFIALVKRAKEYISTGDIFQVVIANTFFSEKKIDPLKVFLHLRLSNPSPYHFLVRYGQGTLVGASPEVMLRGGQQSDGKTTVNMRLVAGTYPKAAPGQAEVLGRDTKELAEHLMLVDHARNDIGRVAECGKVAVSDLFSVETYSNVHHLVSQVSGVLKREEDVLSALQSSFPIATLTGTPKIRAMEIIAELEAPSRGIFGGAVVQMGYDGSIDSAVAIRALVSDERGTKIQAGAGIVYDSDPSREYEECYWKARALFEAVKAQ